ncbi:pullulanase [Roseobacter sp. YSTF-M11]|uniref:Pullulanase n=1 Tax=Roseobacter insulae TaxID=2859783 RepID=A0A9X1FV31_9RHOB|nr:photosynthetic complex assembly protein PuhC [Roseobacter insulae]MBW4708294.1 pullulanase [Roseobacter insulae]
MTMQTQPRIHAKPDDLVPRILVRIMFGLVACVLVIVSLATLTGRPLESTPAMARIIAERAIVLTGDASGAARVLDVNGVMIADFPSDKGGFIAGVERVLARERAKVGVSPTAPVLLQLRAGNRLSLYDPATGWSAELMGFGASNTRIFARLLDQPKP